MKFDALKVERAFPYLLAVGGTAIWWLGSAPFPMPADSLLAASGTASAVLVGFLATAKAVILSISSTQVFEKLKTSKYNSILFEYLFEAVICAIIFLLVSMVGFFISSAHKAMPSWYTMTWILFGLFTLATYLRITSILFKLLKWV